MRWKWWLEREVYKIDFEKAIQRRNREKKTTPQYGELVKPLLLSDAL